MPTIGRAAAATGALAQGIKPPTDQVWRFGCEMEIFNAQSAQRLWLLERIDGGAPDAGRDICRFTGALGILTRNAIHILFLRSPDAPGTTAERLSRPGLRWDLER